MPSDKPEQGRCGAKIPKSTQKYGKEMYCTRTPGYGTDHKGRGKCKFHGGLSTGRNSPKRLLRDLKKSFEPYLRGFTELSEIEKWDLDLELFANKLMLQKLLNHQIESDEIPDEKIVRAIAAASEAIRKNIETQYQMRYEGIAKFQISIIKAMISIIINDLMSLDEDIFRDKEKRERSIMQILYSSFRRALYENEPSAEHEGRQNEVDGDDTRIYDCVI